MVNNLLGLACQQPRFEPPIVQWDRAPRGRDLNMRKVSKPITQQGEGNTALPTAEALRGAAQLAVEAVVQVSRLAGAVHGGIQRVSTLTALGSPEAAGGIAGMVYRVVGGVTRVVGHSLDALLRRLPAEELQQGRSRRAAALLSALNGVLGDHLEATGNPLAIPMQLLHRGQRVAFVRPPAPPKTKLLVVLHGLCMSPQQWQPSDSADNQDTVLAPIDVLADQLGYCCLHLHYNSGRHIADNGRDLAQLLQQLTDAWAPKVESISLIGHSMGGLVARSACVQAQQAGLGWLTEVDKLITLGSPHLGAPLERAGNGVDHLLAALPLVAPFARLGKLRSSGITDLRHGCIVRPEGDRFALGVPVPSPALPASVKLYVVAGSRSASSSVSRPRGDGLVPVTSALGQHRQASRALHVPPSRQCLIHAVHHLELMYHPAVMQAVRGWLREP